MRNILGPNPAIMAARLSLGRLLRAKGDIAGANEQFDVLLKQWEKADADFYMAKVLRESR